MSGAYYLAGVSNLSVCLYFPLACCYQHVHRAYSKESHLEAIHLTCCR